MQQLRRLMPAAIAAVLCIWYFAAAVPLRHLPQHRYYNLLADAFRAGQTSLLVTPSPELLALPNPYDPAQNAALRLHDATLYRGRYYLYFGPTPALVLFLPSSSSASRCRRTWPYPCFSAPACSPPPGACACCSIA